MNSDIFECELLKKQIKKDQMHLDELNACPCEAVLMSDLNKMRYLQMISHPKSNSNLKLLEKISLLRDSKDERLRFYFNKIVKNILNGRLELH
jgi:hypothetical protein